MPALDLLFVVLLFVSFSATNCVGQVADQTAAENRAGKAAVTIDDFAWISGSWVGEHGDEKFEETWNPPSGDTMVGVFKSIRGGKVAFYEILTISPKDDSFVLRLKHFDPQLVGWEEKDECLEVPLQRVDADEAVFEGLAFERRGEDRLTIRVLSQNDTGADELKFEFERVK